MAQDKDYWRALVKAALHLRVAEAMELVNYLIYFLDTKCFAGDGVLLTMLPRRPVTDRVSLYVTTGTRILSLKILRRE